MDPAERLARRMPSADDIEAIARRTMERPPSPFAESLDDIVLRVGPRLSDGTEKEKLAGFEIRIPAEIQGRGVTAGTLGNFRHKQFIVDLVQAKTSSDTLGASLAKRLGPEQGRKVLADLQAIGGEILGKPNALVDALSEFGVKHVEMPATPERIWRAMQR